MSKRPCFLIAPWMHAAPAAWSVTSNGAASPFSPLALSSLTRSFNAAASRAFSITCAPAVASDCAIAQPSPRDAPLIKATLPVRSNIAPPPNLLLSLFCSADVTHAIEVLHLFLYVITLDVRHASHCATAHGMYCPP